MKRHRLERLSLPFRLPGALREFLSQRMTVAEAEGAVKRALAAREERFLELARTELYGRAESPYRRLLEHAGCGVGDLDAHVRRDGLEATLELLAREGVHLTDAESKGRQEVVRGSLRFRVAPRSLEPAAAEVGFVSASSGSRGDPVLAVSSLGWLGEEAPGVALFLAAHALLGRAFATFEPLVPGGAGIKFLLMAGRFGVRADRRFARVVPSHTRTERVYNRLVAYELAALSSLFGAGVPRPRFVDPADPSSIVDWAVAVRRSGRQACLRTVASNAARIARAALELGRPLDGLTFIATGEPLTETKKRVMEEAGAGVTLLYGYEPGPTRVGYGCAEPAQVDDMHVCEDRVAVIEHPSPLGGTDPAIRPLLFTTLSSRAPRLQLNVAAGDYAALERRPCGCALGRAGLTLHIHRVRSYEKLSSEGMNVVLDRLHEILDAALPSELGGGPGDYQLVEEEDALGQTRLTLLIDPSLGAVDEARALACVHGGLQRSGGAARYQAKAWEQYGTLRVRREAPRTSAHGKVLPLHIER
jgi:hypothetical protein